ncbi:MAG: hypothetical protein AB7N80_04295 [Bdellovibrionales bacterium]
MGTRSLGAILLILFAKGAVAADGVCFADPEQLFKSQPKIAVVYECSSKTESKLCTSDVGSDCQRVHVEAGLERLNSSRYILGNKNSVAAQNLIKSQSPRKQVLGAYLSAMDYSEGIIVDPLLSIQTGPYPQVMVSPQALNSKCMTAIVQAAYKLHTFFQNYSFVVDSHIQSCQNLKDGIRQLIAQREKVQGNLNQFHSPLHSVFLTNRTRFVNKEIGQMGLHINVDREGEIRRRLIDFEVSAIPTDSPRTRLSGLSN